jgi:deoxyribonuclease V
LNGTGRDHPRHAGIALHLGSQLRVPTVGTTNRTLVARGTWPQPLTRGARAPLAIGEEVVGYWLCTVSHARPLAVHAAWRTSAEVAANLALAATLLVRTPEPLRQARRLAREARSKDGG